MASSLLVHVWCVHHHMDTPPQLVYKMYIMLTTPGTPTHSTHPPSYTPHTLPHTLHTPSLIHSPSYMAHYTHSHTFPSSSLPLPPPTLCSCDTGSSASTMTVCLSTFLMTSLGRAIPVSVHTSLMVEPYWMKPSLTVNSSDSPSESSTV